MLRQVIAFHLLQVWGAFCGLHLPQMFLVDRAAALHDVRAIPVSGVFPAACTCARTMSHALREIDPPLVKSSPMEQRNS